MRIIGIDPSLSRTGVCIIDGSDVGVSSIVASSKLLVYERQTAMVKGVCNLLQKGDVVTLEEFGASARFALSGRFVERIEICGMLKLLIPRATGFPWLSVSPTLLKSFVAGKASAKKNDVLFSVREQWKVNVGNDDEADAFGLAVYTRAVLHGDKRYARKVEKFIAYSFNKAALAKIAFVGVKPER